MGLQSNIISYNGVIDDCVESGDMEKAAEWLFMAQKARLKPDIMIRNSAIHACARFGAMEKTSE